MKSFFTGLTILLYGISISVIEIAKTQIPASFDQLAMKGYNQLNYYYSISHVVLIVFLLLIWRKELFKCMKYLFPVLMLFAVGCRPYDVPEFVEFKSNQTAFIVPLNKQEKANYLSPEFLKNNVVVGRIQIPHEWNQTGRMYYTGEYLDTHRVIIVDRSPVTRQWAANSHVGTSNSNQAIWVESKDSVGFSTGISITALIEDDVEEAIKFLHFYPATKTDNAEYTESISSLTTVVDNEVRARVQKIYAREAAKTNMDELRTLKNEIMEAVETDIVPFFKERGITITTIGQFGGFTYENPEIQKSIDKVFQAQQDEEVAIAESKAAEQRKVALKLEGEGEAAKVLESKRGEAEAVRMVAEAEAEAIKAKAEARAFELQKVAENSEQYIQLRQLEIDMQRIEKWSGVYPQTMLSSDSNLLLNLQ